MVTRPFIYLIERDPADVWLTLLSMVFLLRCFLLKDWLWAKQKWFKFTIIFWLYCVLSSFFSPYFFHSFTESILWIRFPLYVVAAQAWLGKEYETRILMFVSIFISMIIMCFILGLEIIIDPKYNHRLTWPYGDQMPGSYLSKISLQVFCAMVLIFLNRFHLKNIFIGILAFLSLAMVFLSGERMNFLIRLGAGVLSVFSWHFNIKKFFSFILIVFFILVSLFVLHPPMIKIYKTFIDKMPLLNMEKNNAYWETWRGGFNKALKTYHRSWSGFP